MNTDFHQFDLIAFDLDNTLSESKLIIDTEMADLLAQLLGKRKVAVISGGGFPQLDKELISRLPTTSNLTNLHIFPTDGACYYSFISNEWKQIYIEKLSDQQKAAIKDAFHTVLEELHFDSNNIKGELIEDRQSAMVFSGLGQEADFEAKKAWDPQGKIRFEIKSKIEKLIPEFEISVAGTTSIDVTSKGLDKAFGIRKMIEYIKVPLEKIVFIGDAIFPGGNDYPVTKTGVKTISVKGPEDTKRVIRDILAL